MNQYKGECLCGACRYVITGQKPSAMFFVIAVDAEKKRAQSPWC
jgi:hypothetical protein